MPVEIVNAPEEKYVVMGYKEGAGDPHLVVELRPGNYDNTLLPLGDVAESVRAAMLSVPEVESAQIEKTQTLVTNAWIPAP